MRSAGVLVRQRFSELHPGEVTGYAVALPGCAGPDGTPRWHGGGRLHDSLTLPRLRQGWAAQQREAGRSGAFRFTAPERAEIYRHAARQAAAAAEHLRHCAAGDPGDGADAAWAAADTLHAAARATGSPALRCAADRYDRAARRRMAGSRTGPRHGDQLRAAARLLAMTGQAAGQGAGPAGALAANLIALTEAVAGLREAQAHAAQAAAARRAAEQLHAAFTQARRRAPHPGQLRDQAARPGGPAGRAEDDFPVPLTEVVNAAAAHGSSRAAFPAARDATADPGQTCPLSSWPCRLDHHVRPGGEVGDVDGGRSGEKAASC